MSYEILLLQCMEGHLVDGRDHECNMCVRHSRIHGGKLLSEVDSEPIQSAWEPPGSVGGVLSRTLSGIRLSVIHFFTHIQKFSVGSRCIRSCFGERLQRRSL